MIHKRLVAVLVLGLGLAFITACDELPKNLSKLYSGQYPVPEYQGFEQIDPVQAVPVRSRLSLGGMILQSVLGGGIKYEFLSGPGEYVSKERDIIALYQNEDLLQDELRLLSYARQLSAGHRYRYNPYLPFLTVRPGNEILAGLKTGPAAAPPGMMSLKGDYVGEVRLTSPQGKLETYPIKVASTFFPDNGAMLVFDHALFTLDELMKKPGTQVLQDVLAHEMTHVWSMETLNGAKIKQNATLNSRTKTGHDAMLVSNPTLAYSEGLAEAFEAVFGISLDREDRKLFDKSSQVKTLNFLLGRQLYIRHNAYVYNLFDDPQCVFKKNVVQSEYNTAYLMQKFYSDGDPVHFSSMKNICKLDSPARLESKEGFVASLFYEILMQQALLDRKPDFDGETLAKYQPEKLWLASYSNKQARTLASAATAVVSEERIREFRKDFLANFRLLALGMIHSQALSITELFNHLLTSPEISDNGKLRLAFHVLKISKGVMASDPELRKLFASNEVIRKSGPQIERALKELLAGKRLAEIWAKVQGIPELYVQYSGAGRSTEKRININRAYESDLVDLLAPEGTYSSANNKRVYEHPDFKTLVGRLENQQYIDSMEQFLALTSSIRLQIPTRSETGLLGCFSKATAEIQKPTAALVSETAESEEPLTSHTLKVGN